MSLSPPIIFPSLAMSPMTITPNLVFIFPAYVSKIVYVGTTEQHIVLFPGLFVFKKYVSFILHLVFTHIGMTAPI